MSKHSSNDIYVCKVSGTEVNMYRDRTCAEKEMHNMQSKCWVTDWVVNFVSLSHPLCFSSTLSKAANSHWCVLHRTRPSLSMHTHTHAQRHIHTRTILVHYVQFWFFWKSGSDSAKICSECSFTSAWLMPQWGQRSAISKCI